MAISPVCRTLAAMRILSARHWRIPTTLRCITALGISAFGLVVASCRQPRIAAPVSPDGCYALTLGPWSARSYSSPPPTAIALDTVLVVEPSFFATVSRRRVRPDVPERRRGSPPPQWTVVGPDSITVQWSTGYTGYVLSLGPEQGGLRHGAYKSFRDLRTVPELPAPRAEVTARRTSCAALGLE
jgi:hypothetical protein